MLFVHGIQTRWRTALPESYSSLSPEDKLQINRSVLPAITHVDFSARIQTVHPETNPCFNQLLTTFQKLTCCPVLVNTSFNVRGEPIVCAPEEAIRCFIHTDMDVLVLNNFMILKKEQMQTVKAFN
jgi:carbamoyltransferase